MASLAISPYTHPLYSFPLIQTLSSLVENLINKFPKTKHKKSRRLSYFSVLNIGSVTTRVFCTLSPYTHLLYSFPLIQTWSNLVENLINKFPKTKHKKSCRTFFIPVFTIGFVMYSMCNCLVTSYFSNVYRMTLCDAYLKCP